MWTWHKANKTLDKLHKKHPIKTIHSFWIGECSMISARFAKKHGINHVTTVMGQDALAGNSYVKYIQNSKIVTLSKNHHAELLKNYNLQSYVIPWSLDQTSVPTPKKSTIDILGVGSLNTVKNYSFFIEIIAHLVKIFPNLKVEIIGEGNEYTTLYKHILSKQLDNHIKLLGRLPRAKVLEKMTKARILLHTSTYESFGFVFLEALCAGMKIVSHDVGIANEQSFWRVCQIEKAAFANACSFFLNEKEVQKKRLCITDTAQTINAYKNLYALKD